MPGCCHEPARIRAASALSTLLGVSPISRATRSVTSWYSANAPVESPSSAALRMPRARAGSLNGSNVNARRARARAST